MSKLIRVAPALFIIALGCQPPPSDSPRQIQGGCAELGYHGACQGDVAVWCDGDAPQRTDCAVIGERCGWVDNTQGFYCGGEPQGAEDFEGPIAGCGDVPAEGTCSGSELIWCANGTLRRLDCAVAGAQCTFIEADSAYACVLGGDAGGAGGAGGAPLPPPQPEAPAEPDPMPPAEPEPAGPGAICDQGNGASRCEGNTAVWCDAGEEQRRDCGAQGCGWVNDQIGNYCGGTGQDPNGGQPEPPAPDPDPPAPNPDPPAPNPEPPAPNPEPAPPAGDCGSPEEAATVQLANQARAQQGLPSLSCDAQMIAAARNHSQDMCNQGYFSHTGRDGSQPWDRMRREGVQFRTAGENIALGQRDANQVHTSWMNSAGHRRNILGNAWGRIGVGYVNCNGRPHWTQVFAD